MSRRKARRARERRQEPKAKAAPEYVSKYQTRKYHSTPKSHVRTITAEEGAALKQMIEDNYVNDTNA